MIADALGWTLDRISDDVQPKLATVTVASEFLAVDPGYVCGIIQDGVGYRKGQPAIRLHMEAYLGAPDSYDSVEIEGSPSLSMKISTAASPATRHCIACRQLDSQGAGRSTGAAHDAIDRVTFFLRWTMTRSRNRVIG